MANDETTETTPTEDEASVKAKFKGWMSELLDEREAKAAQQRKEQEKEEPTPKTQAPKLGAHDILKSFLGF